MPIVRRYSPPFQAAAPRPGADNVGAAVKGLISVEVARTNEISFAVESFGCDGKPVLSMLRGLPCESTGNLVVAGTKNGMPFKLNGDLPRTLGSAIRGAGGSLRTVAAGTSLRTTEWVIYDNVGNCWSLDELTGGKPTYIGETPPEIGGDGVTPTLCVQAPGIRPYEKRWEYVNPSGEGGDPQAQYYWAGAGWQDDAGSPVIAWPIAYPYADPSEYRVIEQWVPDETTPPTGGELAAGWPGMVRRVDVEWYPGAAGQPHDWDAETDNSCDEIVSKYPAVPPWTVHMNRWTRPLIEHISTGGITGEMPFIVAIEHELVPGTGYRLAMRRKNTGELINSLAFGPLVTTDPRTGLTPYKGEGWIRQGGGYTGTPKTATVYRINSRASSTDNYGTALTYLGVLNITLPADAAYDWAEPVWFRVGRIIRALGSTPRIAPLLPRWR